MLPPAADAAAPLAADDKMRYALCYATISDMRYLFYAR